MTRKTYETADHIAAEKKAFDYYFRTEYSPGYIKAPKYYPFDYCVKDSKGRIIEGVEIKVRDVDLEKLGSVKISLQKFAKLVSMTWVLPISLIVQANDGMYRLELRGKSYEDITPCVWGRRDRGDADDMEPCVEIPLHLFKKIVSEADHRARQLTPPADPG